MNITIEQQPQTPINLLFRALVSVFLILLLVWGIAWAFDGLMRTLLG